ncbi:MAG: response regulator transcription factor [Colwelliaceae bacterium]|nr:response regulator transcription factor [Colwelliaceae bacterium]
MKNNKNIYIVPHNSTDTMKNLESLIGSLGFNVHVVDANPFILTNKPAGIIIIDYTSVSLTEEKLPKQTDIYARKHKILLVNLSVGVINEAIAIQRGCTGAIYDNLRADEVIKAIYAVQQNEYWFSRKNISLALSNILQHGSGSQEPQLTQEQLTTINSLTRREKAIVSLVCKGSSNNDIAESLFISCHTVKTHIYSAFRKTQCKNRVELIYWAMKNAMAAELTA